jgi:hypothetical protein
MPPKLEEISHRNQTNHRAAHKNFLQTNGTKNCQPAN